jgi:hypothetical protein
MPHQAMPHAQSSNGTCLLLGLESLRKRCNMCDKSRVRAITRDRQCTKRGTKRLHQATAPATRRRQEIVARTECQCVCCMTYINATVSVVMPVCLLYVHPRHLTQTTAQIPTRSRRACKKEEGRGGGRRCGGGGGRGSLTRQPERVGRGKVSCPL